MSEDPNESQREPVDDPGDDAGKNTDPADSETVSRRAYKKALSEAKAAKARLKELEADQERRKQEQLEQDGSLQEKIDFYKSKNDELSGQINDLTQELTGQKEQWNDATKLAAFKTALDARLGSQYLSLVDTSEILIDPETGSPDPASVAKAVDSFKKKYPEVVHAAKNPKSPSEFPSGQPSGTLTPEEFRKLPYAEKLKRRGEVKFT